MTMSSIQTAPRITHQLSVIKDNKYINKQTTTATLFTKQNTGSESVKRVLRIKTSRMF